MAPNLEVNVGGLVLKNPVTVASGTFGWGEAYEKLEGFDNDVLGAIILKGTTLEPREGNPVPRIVETAGGAGIINSIGLQNPGVDAVIRDHLPGLEGCKAKIVANVAGSTVDEYAEVVSRFNSASLERGGRLVTLSSHPAWSHPATPCCCIIHPLPVRQAAGSHALCSKSAAAYRAIRLGRLSHLFSPCSHTGWRSATWA